MTYHIEFTEFAKKQLKKLDRYTASLIVGWIKKNLECCKDPRILGKALKSNKRGQWRYRIGDYRILTLIQDKKLVILIIAIGHRKEIYD